MVLFVIREKKLMDNNHYEMSEKVSIVVPVYNCKKYLQRCIDSLLTQSYANIEIICVDDGSVDGSSEILDCIAAKETRVKVIHTENQGAGSARNTGLDNACGKYVMFVDADDWVDKDCIEKLVYIMHREKVECILFPYIREFAKKSIHHFTLGKESKKYCFESIDENYLLKRLFGLDNSEIHSPDSLNDISTSHCKFWLRGKLTDVRFPVRDNIISGEDCIFNIMALKTTKKYYYTTDVFYHYNKENMQSIVHTFNPFLPKQYAWQCDWMEDKIDEWGLGCDFKEAVNNRRSVVLLDLARNIMSSPMSIRDKYTQVKALLKDELLKTSLNKLPINKMDYKWRIYFFLAKNQNAFGIIVMTVLAERLKKYLR